MARKTITVTQDMLLRLEGICQALKDTPVEARPKVFAPDYVAQQLAVSRRTLREWVNRLRPATRNSDIADAFLDVYTQIGTLLSEGIVSTVFDTAQAAGGRDAIAAAKYLLPKIDPERFGPQPEYTPEDDVLGLDDIGQEVFDAMTDEEREKLAKLRQQVYEAFTGTEDLIKRVQQRVLADEIEERALH